MFKQLLLLFFLFLTYTGYGQSKKFDTVQLNLSASSIDSAETSGRNIGDFILRKYRHTRYHVDIHYIVDTVSKRLLKCGYYEYYSGNEDETELRKAIFYYDKGNFLLTKLFTVSKGNKIALGKLYFEHQNGKVVGLQSSAVNKSWDLNRVQDKTNDFLLDFAGIVDLMERRKKGR
jgi:hypothetical protein